MPLKNLIEQGVRTGIGIAVDKLIPKYRFSITKFKEAVAKEGGLSRGVFFDCLITLPDYPGFFNEGSLSLCKAANMPAAQLDTAEVKYFTRSVKIPASRQFSPVTLTFYNTESYVMRDQFLTWLSLFNSPVSNVRGARDVDPRIGTGKVGDVATFTRKINYADIILTPRNQKHAETGRYHFYSAFPTSVGAVSYSYENDSQFHTYDVEFQYLSSTFTPESASLVTTSINDAA